ncbi:prepilin-type N-terminal cleavage/methylation domain-containing protein [Psychrobacillus sp. OK032]|uniref:prepilin-type N-terminal cleavage/methylation domain-containing protein n=1 Tax=Psychrobacillus sp. OK032 TaxID=1884358 RepID=UPI0008CCDAB0|nr:prepilin-type N-terminal cleavage/methylation domain-containing protein [Psychrobacillus sp. OK032]
MRIKSNERGFTLLELLSTLVLFSIFAVIIWSFFFQSIKFNDVEISKNQLQQEANLIVNTIQQVHTTSSKYTISTNTSETSLTISNNQTEITFDKNNVQYNLYGSEILPNGDYHLFLTLTSTQNSSVNFITETTFSKLR